MKKTFFELIADIQKDLDLSKNLPENNKNNEIPKEKMEKYDNFKKWLDETSGLS